MKTGAEVMIVRLSSLLKCAASVVVESGKLQTLLTATIIGLSILNLNGHVKHPVVIHLGGKELKLEEKLFTVRINFYC